MQSQTTPAAALTPEQRLRADRLVSVFENGTMDFQYSYAKSIDDSCGYTSGRIGFCTSGGDLLEVVERYSQIQPKNPLVTYLPRLRELAKKHSRSVVGLEDYPKAIEAAAKDPEFRKIQDQIVDESYYQPAVKLAAQLQLHFALSIAALYETGVQFGWGSNSSSASRMAKAARTIVIATDGTYSEAAWLKEFLTLRRDRLANSKVKAARDSVGRGNAMLGLVARGNFDFHGPISIAPYSAEEVFTIP